MKCKGFNPPGVEMSVSVAAGVCLQAEEHVPSREIAKDFPGDVNSVNLVVVITASCIWCHGLSPHHTLHCSRWPQGYCGEVRSMFIFVIMGNNVGSC